MPRCVRNIDRLADEYVKEREKALADVERRAAALERKKRRVVVSIQRWARGMITRIKVYPILKERLEAATMIANKARQRKARERVERRRTEAEEQKQAAMTLQCKIRTRGAKKKVQEKKEERVEQEAVAVKLQGLGRQRIARKKVGQKRVEKQEGEAAVKLQMVGRSGLAKREAERRRKKKREAAAILVMQCCARIWLARRRVERRKEEIERKRKEELARIERERIEKEQREEAERVRVEKERLAKEEEERKERLRAEMEAELERKRLEQEEERVRAEEEEELEKMRVLKAEMEAEEEKERLRLVAEAEENAFGEEETGEEKKGEVLERGPTAQNVKELEDALASVSLITEEESLTESQTWAGDMEREYVVGGVMSRPVTAGREHYEMLQRLGSTGATGEEGGEDETPRGTIHAVATASPTNVPQIMRGVTFVDGKKRAAAKFLAHRGHQAKLQQSLVKEAREALRRRDLKGLGDLRDRQDAEVLWFKHQVRRYRAAQELKEMADKEAESASRDYGAVRDEAQEWLENQANRWMS